MSGDAHATPQSGRRPRLGLGRRGCHSTPLMRLQGEESSVKTPKNDTPRTFSLSLSARRIGLSKNRTELPKKKLEFAAVQEIKDTEPSGSQVKAKNTKEPKKKKQRREDCNKPEDEKGKPQDPPKKREQDPPKKQEEDPPQKQDPLKNMDQRPPKNSRILELQGDIEVWRKGFIASVDDLQAMAEPGLTKRDLLTQLGIPLEMMRYLEED